jgi:hypothetical protein
MNEPLETDTVTCERLNRIGERIQCRLGGRVRDFQVFLSEQGVVLRGHAHTYHAKQLAQQAVLEAVGLPIRANEIEVSRAGLLSHSAR